MPSNKTWLLMDDVKDIIDNNINNKIQEIWHIPDGSLTIYSVQTAPLFSWYI